jgi:hypothetical protein
VGGGDELPFRLAGAYPSALEAVDPAEELGVCENGLDDLLAPPVERLPRGCVEDRFDAAGLFALRRSAPSTVAIQRLRRSGSVTADQRSSMSVP